MLKYQNLGVRADPIYEGAPLDVFLGQRERVARGAFQVLERLSVGIVLVDQSARVLYINAFAQSLGSDGGIFKLPDQTIATWSPSHSRRLAALIRAAQPDAPVRSISLPRPYDGLPLTIVVYSLEEREGPFAVGFDDRDNAILLFIIDPASCPGVPVDWLIDAYGLTPAEARVALSLSSGRTVPETANRFGLSRNTIKSQLKAVFTKTGTTRQAGLARLLASIGLLGIKKSLKPNRTPEFCRPTRS